MPIRIDTLKPGDVVRNLGSGNAYVVVRLVHDDRGRPRSAIAVRTLEISNPREWDPVPPEDLTAFRSPGVG